MSCRLAFALLAVVAGCDASLGSGPLVQQDAAVIDASRIDTPVTPDATPDARECTGGNAAALAPDGSCLVHVTTAATYVNAKTGCAALGNGAHLAYLKGAALDTFAEAFIGTVDTWIGGNDMVTEMSFVWEDGTPFTFTNWATNEPNNANNNFQEDCVIIAGARVDKKWDDRPCDSTEVATSGSFAYLCQY
jgi:hypothetical protein